MAPQYHRRVIRISAADSPNVRLGLAQVRAGRRRPPECLVISEDNPHGAYSRDEWQRLVVKWVSMGCREPDEEQILPGVLSWGDYVHRHATWGKIRKVIGLGGVFYEGSEVLLFPPQWWERSERLWETVRGRHRVAKGIGIDPAEGGDKTSMCAVDELGIIELTSRKTPWTHVITSEALAFMRKHGVAPERVCFDRGGGGKQHADRLRAPKSEGGHELPVRTVGFGEGVAEMPKRGLRPIADRRDIVEERYAYEDRRAQLFGELHRFFDPGEEGNWIGGVKVQGFAVPPNLRGKADDPTTTLRNQLEVLPLLYSPEGRLMMLPKNRRAEDKDKEPGTVKTRCWADMIGGHSPDEADAVALALHAMLHEERAAVAGALT